MQRKGPRRDGAKERFWRRAVRRQRHSGQSIRAYCRAHGLAEASFYAWRRELARREQPAPGVLRGRQQLEEAPAFVPVEITSPGALSLGGVWVECWLPGGVVLRLPVETAPGRLAEVIAACEQRHEAWSEKDGRAASRPSGRPGKEGRRC